MKNAAKCRIRKGDTVTVITGEVKVNFWPADARAATGFISTATGLPLKLAMTTRRSPAAACAAVLPLGLS